MPKRKKSEFVIEKLVNPFPQSGDIDVEYTWMTWPTGNTYENTAQAVAAVKRSAEEGKFRVVIVTDVFELKTETTTKVTLTRPKAPQEGTA